MESRNSHPSGPKSFFPYDAPLGRHAKEKQTEIHIKRKDPLSKKVKVVPEMMEPIFEGRKPIPIHQLLEDEWRAFRSAARFHSRLAALPNHVQFQGAAYPTYDSSFPPLSGYLYSHYKACLSSKKTAIAPLRRVIPTTAFVGPFQSVVNVPDCSKTQRLLHRDRSLYYPDASLALKLRERANDMAIYNEPDVIPQSCLDTRFGDSLSLRSMKQSRLLRPLYQKTSKQTNKLVRLE